MGEKLKALMEKVEPWQWAVGVVVAIFGLVTYFRNRNKTEYVTVPQPTAENVPSQSTGDLESMADNIGTVLAEQDNKLQEVSGKLVTLNDSFNTTREEQNNNISKTYDAIQTQSDTFNNSFNQAVNSFNSSLVQTNKQIEEVSRSYETNTNIAAKTPNLGNNGVGYVAGTEKSMIGDIKSSADKQSAEIERTKQVIADREAQGLDTSLQKKWLEKIS